MYLFLHTPPPFLASPFEPWLMDGFSIFSSFESLKIQNYFFDTLFFRIVYFIQFLTYTSTVSIVNNMTNIYYSFLCILPTLDGSREITGRGPYNGGIISFMKNPESLRWSDSKEEDRGWGGGGVADNLVSCAHYRKRRKPTTKRRNMSKWIL